MSNKDSLEIQRGFLIKDIWKSDNKGDMFKIGFSEEQSMYIPILDNRKLHESILNLSAEQDSHLSIEQMHNDLIKIGFSYFSERIEHKRKLEIELFKDYPEGDEVFSLVNSEYDNQILFFHTLIEENNLEEAKRIYHKINTEEYEAINHLMQEAYSIIAKRETPKLAKLPYQAPLGKHLI